MTGLITVQPPRKKSKSLLQKTTPYIRKWKVIFICAVRKNAWIVAYSVSLGIRNLHIYHYYNTSLSGPQNLLSKWRIDKNSRILKFNVIDRNSSHMQSKGDFENKFLPWQSLKKTMNLWPSLYRQGLQSFFAATFKAKTLKKSSTLSNAFLKSTQKWHKLHRLAIPF